MITITAAMTRLVVVGGLFAGKVVLDGVEKLVVVWVVEVGVVEIVLGEVLEDVTVNTPYSWKL